MKYDILLSEKEIELCHEQLNIEEKNCKKITALIYDSTRWPGEKCDLLVKKRIPLKNYYLKLFNKFISNISHNIFARKQVAHHAKVISERSTGMFSPYRFFHIYKHIMRIRPISVIEYGAGASTVFIAELLRYIHRENGIKGKVVSFEQSEYYCDLLKKNIPNELREYVEIILAPLQLQRFGDYRGLSYKIDKYPNTVDFAYIDGPTRIKGDSNNPIFWFMSDIINLINNGCDLKFALTDHRYINYVPYKKLIGDKYHIKLLKRYRSIEIQKK
jgi:hypothetical protein